MTDFGPGFKRCTCHVLHAVRSGFTCKAHPRITPSLHNILSSDQFTYNSPTMFHTGDLQSGISLAISETKLVACFVHSPSDSASSTWESWLSDDALLETLSTKAVILRIEAESKEASFLAAFCPIQKTPTFVVIRNGQVLEKVEGGVTREEFLGRIGRAMDVDISESDAKKESSNVVEAPAAQEPVSAQPVQQQPSSSSSNPPESPEVNMTSLFPDRASRASTQNDQVRAAEAAEKAARTAARRKEAEEAHAFHAAAKDKGKGKEGTDKGKEAARRDYMVQQSKAKQDAKAEKARILAQIEADRAERKARSQRAPVEAAESSPMSPSAEAASRRMGAGGMCALQIRLFDGTSIKQRFEPSATLEGGVRSWIKSQEGVGEDPFTFKMLRAPLPSRTIEISEEHQTLYDLGLTPNATLVLVPVQGYTNAYGGNEGRGYMSSALHMAYGVASGATGILGAALSYVPGFGPAERGEDSATGPSEAMRPQGTESNADGSATIKVKTLADQRADAARKEGKKTEFYNGNSSAFEGRKDDDGAEGKND